MTEHPPAPTFGDAVSALLSEAEATNTEIAELRRKLDWATLKRQKLFTAIDAAATALPWKVQTELAHRVKRLAETMTPPRGRKVDSAQQAVIEYLADRAQDPEREVVRVNEVQYHLERIGLKPLRGYASNCMARLAEQGFALKLGHGRFRINTRHPEILVIRFRLMEESNARIKARDREIAEAERRGREGRRSLFGGRR